MPTTSSIFFLHTLQNFRPLMRRRSDQTCATGFLTSVAATE